MTSGLSRRSSRLFSAPAFAIRASSRFPRIPAMRQIVESAEIEGGELPETVTIKSGNGAVSRIVFRADSHSGLNHGTH